MPDARKVPELCRELGRRISALRKKANLTQEQLAEKVGTDTSYLARIEIGQRQPSLVVLQRFADALGVPLGQLFAGWGVITKVTGGDKAWLNQAKRLGTAIEGLSVEDLKLLVKVAERMGR